MRFMPVLSITCALIGFGGGCRAANLSAVAFDSYHFQIKPGVDGPLRGHGGAQNQDADTIVESSGPQFQSFGQRRNGKKVDAAVPVQHARHDGGAVAVGVGLDDGHDPRATLGAAASAHALALLINAPTSISAHVLGATVPNKVASGAMAGASIFR